MAKVSWRTDLLASFAERDTREKAQAAFIIEYTRLADRAASLASPSIGSAASPPPSTDAAGETSPNLSTAAITTTPTAELQALHSELSTLRTNLANSQKERTTLQSQLTLATTHLSQLQKSSAANLRELGKVKQERYTLEQKVKQKEDESKVNRKLIENLQDEILTLNIQLDITDESKSRLVGENDKLKSENNELIARWMALKKNEADAMNDNSKFS